MKTFLLFALQLVTASGFAAMSTAAQRPKQALNMFNLQIPSIDMPTEIPSFDLPSALLSTTDNIEDEAVNGLTHALLDFSGLWGSNQVVLKSMEVIGRTVVLGQSLAHSNSVMPDELLFQVGFLGLACHSLASVVIPKAKAQKASVLMTSKDRLAFRSLFRPAGFSWQQFRELSTGSKTMEWITAEPGEVISQDSALWLYQGEVKVVSEGSAHTVTGPSLVGEEHLISLLGNGAQGCQDKKTYIAEGNGATFLRINTDNLQLLMKGNDDLTVSIGKLTFTAMQNRLNALMTAN